MNKIQIITTILLFNLIIGFLHVNAQSDPKIKRSEFALENEEGFKEAWKAIRKGNRYYDDGEAWYPNARNYFLKAYKYNSNNPELNYKIAVCYLFTDNKFEAINYLAKAYQEKPNVTEDIKLMMGRAYHLVLDFDNAIVEYEQYKAEIEDPEKMVKVQRYIQQCRNGKEIIQDPLRVIINNLGENINSAYDDYYPILSNNESIMYFTSRRPTDEKSEVSLVDNKYFEEVYKSKFVDDEWQKANRVFAKNIGDRKNRKNNAAVGVNPDGTKVYFYYGKKRNGDIRVIRLKKNKKWSKDRNPKPKINSKYKETTLTYGPEGKRIYFISNNEKTSRGGKDIFFVEKDFKGKWSNPKNLSPIVNTKYDEEGISFSEDGKTLFFSSKGHKTMGGFDVFKTVLDSNGLWSVPENLKYPINTADDDLFYTPSFKGNFAYYSSIRETGVGLKDIYKIIYLGEEKELLLSDEIIPIAGLIPPEPSIFFRAPEILEIDESIILQGKVTDSKSEEPLIAKFEFIDLENNSVVATTMSGSNGEYKVKLPEKKNYGIEISAKDYLLYLDVLNIISDPSDELITRDFALEKVEIGQSIVLENIFFETGKATLKSESYESLNEVVKLLENNPSLRVEIAGHTDNVGSIKSNQKLSENRAKSVVDYLTGQGVSRSRMEYAGYGESKPIAPNTTADGRARNRRVEFKILSK